MKDTEALSLTLLGTGTSQGVPVLGCRCAVCTSADPRDQRLRASALLRAGEENFVIDAGPDFRTQMLKERVKTVAGVLITHEHYDHTGGLDDLRPYCFRQRIDMPVYCLPRVAAELRERFAYAFSGYPGVPRLDIREVNFGDTIRFGGRDIELVEVQHGALPIFGFRWGEVAYFTDVKTLPARTQVQCKGVKTMIISALHHQGTHSHLSLEESLALIKKLAPERGVLIHFSHQMGRTADVDADLPAGVRCGWDGQRIHLER